LKYIYPNSVSELTAVVGCMCLKYIYPNSVSELTAVVGCIMNRIISEVAAGTTIIQSCFENAESKLMAATSQESFNDAM